MPAPTYIADTDGARLVVLEGLTLLFQPRSGMTHILAPPSREILELLAEAPCEAAALLERLAMRFDLADDDEARRALAARLAELEEAGLVRRA